MRSFYSFTMFLFFSLILALLLQTSTIVEGTASPVDKNIKNTDVRLLLKQKDYPDRCEFFAIDPIDGRPMAGLKADLYDESETTWLGTKIFDNKGHLSIPKDNKMRCFIIGDKSQPNKIVRKYIAELLPPRLDQDPKHKVKFYTDRPYYRHGETLRAGLVFYDDKIDGMAVVPNHIDKVMVSGLLDDQWGHLTFLPVMTNAGGVAEISYVLPEDEKYTELLFNVEGRYEGEKCINVDVYKHQQFKVHIDSIPSGVVIGQPIIVCGRVRDFDGFPLSASLTLSYSIAPGQSEVSCEVGEDGNFVIETPPVGVFEEYTPDQIKISAKDVSGRRASAETRLIRGTTELSLRTQFLIDVQKLDKAHFVLSTKGQPYICNRLGNLGRYKVFAYLRDAYGSEISLGELPIEGDKAFSMPSLKSGIYTLGLRATDGYGQSVFDEIDNISIYGRFDDLPPSPATLWVEPTTTEVSDGTRDVVVRVGSSYDTYISIFVEEDYNLVYHDVVQVNKGMETFIIPHQVWKGGDLSITVSTWKDGQDTTETIRIKGKSEEISSPISIEALSYVPQSVIPGSEVKRRYVVKQGDQPLINTSILVTVLDRSLLFSSGQKNFWHKINSDLEKNEYKRFAERGLLIGHPIMRRDPKQLEEDFFIKSHLSGLGRMKTGSLAPHSDPTSSGTVFFNTLLRTNEKGEIEYKYTLPQKSARYLEKVFIFDKGLKHQELKNIEFDTLVQ